MIKKIRTLEEAREYSCKLGDEIILPDPVRKVKKTMKQEVENDED